MMAYFNKNALIKFYQSLNFTNFESITDERKLELDKIVKIIGKKLSAKINGKLSLMTLIAERLTTSYKYYGLLNGDEKAYFFIKIIDPELDFLKAYESGNKLEEIREYFLRTYQLFDIQLIRLEKAYNDKFNEYELENLFNEDIIKRKLVPKD